MAKNIPVKSPADAPSAADKVTTRAQAHAAGVAARPGSHREQSTHVDAGAKIEHELAHAMAGKSAAAKANSRENDARALRNLAQHSK